MERYLRQPIDNAPYSLAKNYVLCVISRFVVNLKQLFLHRKRGEFSEPFHIMLVTFKRKRAEWWKCFDKFSRMDVLDGVPKHVLGYKIQTREKILFTFLVPASLELVAYLIQFLADIGVTIQLFRDHEDTYAWLTLMLVLLPPIVTFIIIITSPWQWPESKGCNAESAKFLFRQILNVTLFPIGTILR